MATEIRESAFALPGFMPLLRKEIIDARRSKRLIAFLVIMTLALLLVPIVGYFQIDTFRSGARHQIPDDDMADMLATWAGIVAYLGSFMIIGATIDAVTRERSLGVTAWIITKPVSRLSYLSAKAIGHTIVGVVTIVIAPSIIWFLLTVVLFRDVLIGNILAAVLILCVELAFLSFLSVALGVVFRSVTPILIFSLGLWFVPTIIPAIVGLDWTLYILPSYLPLAAIVAAFDPSEEQRFVLLNPLASLGISAGVFWLSAVIFERQEL